MSMRPIDSLDPTLVLMTTDTIGGVWNYSLELALGLAANGIRVALATMGQPVSSTQREEASRVPGLQLFESEFRLEWMEDPWRDVDLAGQWLLSLERELEPEVIHLNGYAHGAVGFLAPKLVVAHSCVLSWWSAVWGGNAPDAWSEYRRRVRKGLQLADAVVAPTHAMRAALEDHYGTAKSMRVIPNGRDAAFFQPAAKEEFVLTAGRLGDDAKNVRTLAKAAEGLPWKVRVAGAESDPSGTLRLPANVEYCGRLSAAAVADQMAHAAIYCLPAKYEPFGLSVLEAGLAGCALVLGDIPSLRENWEDAALFVSPQDTLGLRNTLLRLMEDHDLRQACGRAARERALEFSTPRMIDGYLAIYRNLLRKGATLTAA